MRFQYAQKSCAQTIPANVLNVRVNSNCAPGLPRAFDSSSAPQSRAFDVKPGPWNINMVNFCCVFEGTIRKFLVWRMGNWTLWSPHSRAFDQRFSKMSNARGFARGHDRSWNWLVHNAWSVLIPMMKHTLKITSQKQTIVHLIFNYASVT